MKPAQIESLLADLEALQTKSPERFESWHATFLRVARRDFDRAQILKDTALATLEAIHQRYLPPKMGAHSMGVKSSLDGKLGKITTKLYYD